jgi:hypothetical protein
LAQASDGRIQAVFEIDVGPIGPQPPAEVLPRNDLAGSFQQGGQNQERLLLEPLPETVFAEFRVG